MWWDNYKEFFLMHFDTRNNYFWMFVYMNGATEKSPKLKIDKANIRMKASNPFFNKLPEVNSIILLKLFR